jgi:glycosyltransferase involved in cell wall biosynthesis
MMKGPASRQGRICFLINSLNIGGAEKQLLQFIATKGEALKVLDITIITFAPTTIDATPMQALFQRLEINTILIQRSQRSFIGFFLELVRTIRALKPDVVHTVLTGSTGTWGRLAAWLCGVPVIFHSDRDRNPPITRTQRLLRPYLDRVTTRFLPNAQAIADDLVKTGVPRRKIIVMPNGVDTARFNPATASSPRASWRVPEKAVVLGFLGRVARQKRPDLLLDALRSLPECSRPDYVVLGGDGPDMPYVRERCEADAWLKQHCLLPGMVERTPDFLAGIDYLVLCSDSEGTPNAVLEAMAMEKPIVATRVSDVPRLIEGVGFLAAMGDAPGLAAAITRMQKLTCEERAALGKKARARVVEQYELHRSTELFWQTHLDMLPPVDAPS